MSVQPLSPDLTDAVLAHLGVRRAAPDLALLDALIHAYVRTVPWESASRIAKRARTPDTSSCPRWPEEFWTDALRYGTGGTCFESNYAFFSLLRALGFDGYLTINDMKSTAGCHTAAIVYLAGRRWLADAGFPVHVPLALDPETVTSARSDHHIYTATPAPGGRFVITRDRHPAPYCFTLIDNPIPEGHYRAATTADYGPEGLFLDQVIVTRVIDGRIWRFCSNDHPPVIEAFEGGGRTVYPVERDMAAAVARRFALDEATLRAALDAIG